MNNSSANAKLSKTQLSKIVQSGRLLGRLLGPFLKTGFPLKKNVLKSLDKSFLIPLGLTGAASATDDENLSKENFDLWIRDASFRLSQSNNTDHLKRRNGCTNHLKRKNR